VYVVFVNLGAFNAAVVEFSTEFSQSIDGLVNLPNWDEDAGQSLPVCVTEGAPIQFVVGFLVWYEE